MQPATLVGKEITHAAVLAIWPKRPGLCEVCAGGAACLVGAVGAEEYGRCCCCGAAGRAGAVGRDGADRDGPAPPRERGIFAAAGDCKVIIESEFRIGRMEDDWN